MIRNVRILRRAGLLGALLLVSVVASACTGVRIEASWGSLSTTGNPTNILFAYYNQVVKLDPVSGQLAQLTDSDGNVRLDDEGNPRTWVVPAPNNNAQNQFYVAPLEIGENSLLMPSYSAHLFEVEADTARVEDPIGVPIAGPVVAGVTMDENALYVGYSQSDMQALDRSGYAPLWTLDTEHGFYGKPVLLDGILYTASLDHNVYAIDAATGEVIWKTDLAGAITSAPVVANDSLYVGSFANKLYKLNLDGEIVSSVSTSNWVWGSPAVSGDMLYFGDTSGNLYAARDTGSSLELVWGPIPVATGAIVATPLVTENALVVGSRDKNVYWVEPDTGAVLQTRQTKGEVLGNMLLLEPSDALPLSEPIVVVSTLANEELVIAFSLDNGERLWAYQR